MQSFVLGTLSGDPASTRPDLLGAPVAAMVQRLGIGDVVGVAAIDAELSDTAATQAAYGLNATALVNCVIVSGKRDGTERVAACLLPSTKRADVNGVVRRRLDVRKASFLPQADAVERSGMAYGAITPIGLPADWPILIDADVLDIALAVIGSGIRASKLLVPGSVLTQLPGAEIIDGLGRPA